MMEDDDVADDDVADDVADDDDDNTFTMSLVQQSLQHPNLSISVLHYLACIHIIVKRIIFKAEKFVELPIN